MPGRNGTDNQDEIKRGGQAKRFSPLVRHTKARMKFRKYNTGLGVFAGRRERKAMEQFLNLFWLAIVLVTTLTWRTVSARQQRGNHYRSLQHAAALGSAFLLLFFPLSMTDDLHPEIMLVEAGDQRHLIVLACPDQPSHGGTVVWATCVAIVPAREALESLRPSYDLSPVVEVCRSVFEKDHPPDRSPPASRL